MPVNRGATETANAVLELDRTRTNERGSARPNGNKNILSNIKVT